MKASEARLLDLLGKSSQFVIPIYQRTYSWTRSECGQLWNDLVRAGREDSLDAHFIGSIVHVEQGLSNLVTQVPNLVIDGQQRLTTSTLLIAALAEALDNLPEGEREPVDGFSALKLRKRYLINDDEEGEKYYKVVLSQTDRSTLKAIVRGSDLPAQASERVVANYEYFRSKLPDDATDLAVICRGLAKLVVVDIRLDRSHDNPQLIFESMNSTGRKLSQADLIRNFVLMGLEPAKQEQLYEQYWRPMELDFGQAAHAEQFDEFVRHYLTVVTGDIPRLGDIFDAFKVHSRDLTTRGEAVESLVQELRAYSRRYCALALGQEKDAKLAAALVELREVGADVVYPFLLETYTDYELGTLNRDEMTQIVEMVTSYVFRRAVCQVPTNSLNTTFATLGKSLRKDRYLASLRAQFLSMTRNRVFPSDERFHDDLVSRDLYHFKRRSYFLRSLENVGRKERVTIEDYTIEHILPQNPDLSASWRSALGPDWADVQERLLHTLGNLTLTGYNSEYSDRPYAEKRDMDGGFKDSPLRLNQGLGQQQTWDESAILARAERLAVEALKIWQRPQQDPEITASFQTPRSRSAYTIEDHPNLLPLARRQLFDKFRSEVLALDPSVIEQINKLYVSFKAETNFVDVVPQAARLRLTLNLPFDSIHDERRAAWDVTGRGHWGNGDVEVALDDVADLPYVMGLVRQAYEYQMEA